MGSSKKNKVSKTGIYKSFSEVLHLQKRKYAGLITHLGLIILALGIVGSRMYATSKVITLNQGQGVTVGEYQLEYSGLEQKYKNDFLQTQANLIVRDGARSSHLTPIFNQFETNQDVMTVPAVRSSILDDLYVILGGWSEGGKTATFQIHINPLINFVWLGGILFLAGGYLALVPSFSKKSQRNWYLIVGLGLLFLSSFAIWGIPRGVESAKLSRPLVGSVAPSLPNLRLTNGSVLNAVDLQDKILVVNFWSPSCPSCLEELPALQALWENYTNQGVLVVGITADVDIPSIAKTIEQYELTYPVALDENSTSFLNFSVTGVPETYIIDRQGRIAYMKIGATDLSTFKNAVDKVLAEE